MDMKLEKKPFETRIVSNHWVMSSMALELERRFLYVLERK